MWLTSIIRKKKTRNKAIQVARYIVSLRNDDKKIGRNHSLSNLKMQGLLYYCQGNYYHLHDEPLFEDDFIAWPYGPTIPKVFAHFSRYGQNDIAEHEDNYSNLNKQEMDSIKTIWKRFSKEYSFTLVDIMQSETPWIIGVNEKGNKISKDSIRFYFRKSMLN